ncbi:MAG: PA14 domain-containing protein [Planctomycetota bacterium]|nr:PA14 domain-containing protein [Planctomycetota bacterium]
MRRTRRKARRGVAAIVMIVMLLILDLVVMVMVLGGARDQDLTVRRVETVQAFYAAEAGLNMAVREVMLDDDEDGDGTAGAISDDDDEGNDPTFGNAAVHVAMAMEAEGTVLTSHGRAGQARRRLEATFSGSAGAGPNGLAASYFIDDGSPAALADIDWTADPDAVGVVSVLNWPRTSDATPFWVGGPNNNYGAEFAGTITIPDTGSWTFYTESDDGSKLWIDGSEVVNNDGLHAMRERSGAISLAAGPHDFMVRFFERSGNHGLIVSWRGPGVPGRTVIPAEALSH